MKKPTLSIMTSCGWEIKAFPPSHCGWEIKAFPIPPTFSVFITEVEPIDECKKEIKDEILKSIIATLKLTQ